jgi:hypothetical protein
MSPIRRRWSSRVLLVGAVLLALLLCVGSLLDWNGAEAPRAPDSLPAERPVAAIELADREALGSSAWDPSGPTVAEAEVEAAAAPPADIEARLEVTVLLTERASGLPLPAHRVHLWGAGVKSQGVTDPGGRARLLLAGAGWTLGRSIGIEVRDSESARVFWGSVVLAPEVRLALSSRVRLHGRLTW